MPDPLDQPTSSEPARASLDQPKQEQPGASLDQPKQEPGKAPSRRSNEFWLALAGMAATVVVGITGSLLAYQTSTHQSKAESDRAALTFSREQRKTAYADFLTADTDTWRAEYNIKWPDSVSLAGPLDLKQLEDQFKVYTEATGRFNRATSTVKLLASHDVAEARNAVSANHNSLYFQIDNLMARARRGEPIDEIRLNMNLDKWDDLNQHFIDAAKKDLGLAY
jgi:hypothetical protein